MAYNGHICHAKFASHHCWFDVLALIMQTGYEVSSLSVPVVIVATPFLYVQGVVVFTMARGSTTPLFRGLK